MDRRLFVLFFGAQILLGIVFLGLWWFSTRNINSLEKSALTAIDKRIESIVLSTLNKVREDLDLLGTGDEPKKKSSNDEDSDQVTFLGANVRTFNRREFYIDGDRFEVGDIVHPYGVAVAVGRDAVFFDDFTGKPVVLGKVVTQIKELPKVDDKKEKKELTNA